MDSTLLGALIGAGVTLAAVALTAVVNYHFTQKQENLKLKKQKKEELYLSIIDMERAMYLYFICISHAYNNVEYSIDSIDMARDKSIAKMELITTVYFLELNIERSMEAISTFEQSFVYYLRDGFRREFSASDVVNATTLYRNIEKETTSMKAELMAL